MAAPNKGGDSKQGLIVTLVIFVLLSIVLSVFVYTGYDGQKAMDDAKKKAEQDRTAANNDRDANKFMKALLRNFIGIAEKDDQDTLSGLMGNYGQKAEFANVANHERMKEFRWDQAQNKAVPSILDQLGTTRKNLDNARLERAKSEEAFKKAREEFEQQLAEANAALKQAQANNTKLQTDNLNLQNAKSEEYKKALADLAARDATIEDLTKKLSNLQDDKDRQAKQLKKEIEDLNTNVIKAREKLPQFSILDYDAPKGKIVRIDRTGAVVYINLGTADNVKAGLTFSVFANNPGGKPGRTRKGGIEVASVVSEHMSTARVVDVTDPGRNPLTSGDLLFNPAWNSGVREHIAVAGLIDLTGDGRDHTLEFIRAMERQGIVVDAYLDPNDATIKGKMNWNTNFLVLGERPELAGAAGVAKGGDAQSDRRMDIVTKMTELQTSAQQYGVTIVPVRRFLTVIGYKLPRQLGNQSLDFSPRGVSGFDKDAKSADREEKKEEKPEEKKPEEKKDKAKEEKGK